MFLTRERFFFFFFFGAVCPTLQREKPNSFGFLSGVYFSTRDWGAIQEITASPSQTLQSCEDTALKSWFAIPESSSLTKKRKTKRNNCRKGNANQCSSVSRQIARSNIFFMPLRVISTSRPLFFSIVSCSTTYIFSPVRKPLQS